MRALIAFVLLAATSVLAQQSPEPDRQPPVLKSRRQVPPPESQTSAASPQTPPAASPTVFDSADRPRWIVPAGTKIPMQLRQAISTKNAQPGDPIYARTTFPIVIDQRVMIPAGTYVQGVVDRVKRAGRIKGTAELQFHVKSLLYANGYTVDMAAAVDQVPGDENSHSKEPGTVKHDSEKGKDVQRIGRGAAEGGAVGGIAGAAASGTTRGVGIGGLTGVAAGSMIAVMARGSDLRLANGSVVDVVLNHAIALDPDKILRRSELRAY